MNQVTKFILFQVIMLVPFACGYIARRRMGDPIRLTQRLIRINLIAVEPVIVFWTIWGLALSKELLVLPAVGLLLVILGGILAFPAFRLLGAGGVSRPTFVISAGLANHGLTMGGFFCYLLLGERGLGLSLVFISYFMPFIFCVVFPYARRVSGAVVGGKGVLGEYVFTLQNMPLAAMAAAAVLQLSGVSRPAAAFPVDAFVLASIAVYYFSLGVHFKPAHVLAMKREIASLSAIKFILVPAAAYLCLLLAGTAGDMRTVIMLQSFMPAAIYSVVAAVLFRLDVEMASGLFVGNTILFFLLVFPVMMLLRHELLFI